MLRGSGRPWPRSTVTGLIAIGARVRTVYEPSHSLPLRAVVVPRRHLIGCQPASERIARAIALRARVISSANGGGMGHHEASHTALVSPGNRALPVRLGVRGATRQTGQGDPADTRGSS